MNNAISLPSRWIGRHPIKTLVVGAGGTGSHFLAGLGSLNQTVKALGARGFEVTIMDDDRVSASNVGRQRFCAADIGQSKAHMLCHRLNLFHGTVWTSSCRRLTDDALSRVHWDLIITCVDNVETRLMVADYARWGIWLDTGVAKQRGQVVLGHLPPSQSVDGLRAPHVVDLFPDLRNGDPDPDLPSCSVDEALRAQEWPVNRWAAELALSLLWQWLRRGELKINGYVFSTDLSSSPIRVTDWPAYGWTP